MAKVLVADDAVDIVKLLSYNLSRQGYDVSVAYDGREALEVAAAERPDVILLDINMPELDGIEVCRRLKADEQLAAIPVILVTGKDRDEDVIAGLDAGADDYITKPFNNDILAARLRSATRVKSSHDTIARMNRQLHAEINERKLLERELAQAQKLEAIGQLAAGIAHEINTPTQYIGDNTRFLQDAFTDLDKALEAVDRLLEAAKDGTVSEELLDGVQSALQEADIDYLHEEIPLAIRQSLEGVGRVASIVRAMREFSHPGSERKQAVDLNHAIENTLTVSRNEWKYVAELVTDFDPDLPPIACLPSDLNQVILNVVVNAAQAIDEVVKGGGYQQGTIAVSTRRDGDYAEIRIEDTGAGIPEEFQSKVFDPFFTTKEVGKGTGQGLSITHSIVTEKHGGTISFETEPGRGTTFIIRLPIADNSDSPQSVQECQSAPAC